MGRRLGFPMATAFSEPALVLPRCPFVDREARREGHPDSFRLAEGQEVSLIIQYKGVSQD